MHIDRWSVLSGLRFLLAFIVVANHLPVAVAPGHWGFVYNFGALEAILGFLLISGYSIGASYEKTPAGFIERRVRRIYPVYAASIVLALAVIAAAGDAFPSVWRVLANALFLNQIVTHASLVGPAWSLSLEFWLYCLTPLLFKASPATLRWLSFASFGAYLGYTCGRTLFHWDYFSGLAYGLNLLLLSFIWLAGLRLARDKDDTPRILKEIAAMFALHILLAGSIELAASWKRGTLDTFVQGGLDAFAMRTLTLLIVLWIFKWIATSPAGKGKVSSILVILGDISYPLFVTHISVFVLLKATGLESPTLYLVAALVASFILYKLVDRYSQVRHLPGGTGFRFGFGRPKLSDR